MLTYEELKQMKVKELDLECEKAGYELLKLRLALSSRQSKETGKVKLLRKYVARIKTLKTFMKTEKAPENAKSAVIK